MLTSLNLYNFDIVVQQKNRTIIDFYEYCVLQCITRINLNSAKAVYSKYILQDIKLIENEDFEKFIKRLESRYNINFFIKSWEFIKNNNIRACRTIINDKDTLIYRYKNNLFNIDFFFSTDLNHLYEKFKNCTPINLGQS